MTTPEHRAEWLRLCDAATEWKRYLREKKGLVSTMPSESRNFEAIAQCLDALLAENEKLRTDANNLLVSLQNETLEWQKSNGALIERATAAEAERDRLRDENYGMRKEVANIHNTHRHTFYAAVEKALDVYNTETVKAVRAALEPK